MRLLFDTAPSLRDDHQTLLHVIRQVRWRWWLRVGLRGLAGVAVVALTAFLASALLMDRMRFAPEVVEVVRWLAYGVVLLTALRLLVFPFRHRVSDAQVALYVEEHEPSLQGHVVSAVEFGRQDAAAAGHSSVLVQRVVERAVARCAAIENGRRIEAPAIKRSSGWLAGTALASVLLVVMSPGFVKHSAPLLLTPWMVDAFASPYAIEVTPGDVSLPRGADLEVSARAINFTGEATLAVQREAGGEWERWPMVPNDSSGSYGFVVFALDDDATYYVEASGVRSPVFTVTVKDLPWVARMDHEYRFPAYTGLATRTVEDAGDIAVLEGTRVVATIATTVPVTGGMLVVSDQDTISLEAISGTELTATMTVRQRGHYRILLEALDGTTVVGSPDYLVDVLEDQPPLVRFRTPGRDLQATTVDEVFTEVEAEDDFGLGAVELVYRVNGGAERTIELLQSVRRREFSGGHTFFLEEWDLDPGDVVAYFAKALDANGVGGAQEVSTDIYFLEIRPFDRRFRQAAARGQPGGGGGGAGDVGALSARQKQIVAGTFNLVRDSATYSSRDVAEHLATLTLAQGRLREEVTTLLERMQSRGVVQLDSTFQRVAEELPEAVKAMQDAEEQLGQSFPTEALPPEQRALQHLQRAEAAYRDREVTQGGGGSGGGGGEGQSAEAEDLADLFDLEMDRLRNQYESVDRGRQQQRNEQLDEAMERLRDLARRQQQENERLRAQSTQQGGGATGRGQRQLADEAEALARQLQRLAREQSRPELDEAARRLQAAADAMRRAAAQGRSGGDAQGRSALGGLREAQRRLEQSQTDDFRRQVEEAARRAAQLAEEQRGIEETVQGIGASGQNRAALERLLERKQQMAEDVRELESDADRLGREGAREQPDASRELREGARALRDGRVADKILYSQGVVQSGSDQYARSFERSITQDLEASAEQLERALGAIGERPEQRVGQAMERLRDVVGGLESMQERLEQGGQADRRAGGQGQAGQRLQGPGTPQGGAPRDRAGGGDATPDGMRQFQRELVERRRELRELQRELSREGVDVGGLESLIDKLESVERTGLGTPQGLAELRGSVIPGLKEFEFRLRRDLLRGEGDLAASVSEDVPSRYRRLVEAYFRELSRRRP